MEKESLKERYTEFLTRKSELSEVIDLTLADKITQDFQRLFREFNLNPNQFKAVVDWFIWFHYESDN